MKHYFRHFRLFDERNNILPRGGVTVYVRYVGDPNSTVVVTTAVCGHKDPYNKSIGRKIASGRRYSVDAHVIDLYAKDDDITNDLHNIAAQAIGCIHFKGKYNRIGLVYKHDTLDCGDGSDLVPLHLATEETIRRLREEA